MPPTPDLKAMFPIGAAQPLEAVMQQGQAVVQTSMTLLQRAMRYQTTALMGVGVTAAAFMGAKSAHDIVNIQIEAARQTIAGLVAEVVDASQEAIRTVSGKTAQADA